MKIHITRPQEPSIENYKRIEVKDNSLDLSTISDNECESILANELLDSFSVEKIGDVLQAIVKKIRMRGELIIGGTDIRLFAKALINEQVNEMDAARLIEKSQSMTTVDKMAKAVAHLGLEIKSTQIKGIHYDIVATRG